jgi:hypothetical protein
LVRDLDKSSMANGFANRFLFVCAKRWQLLPFGGGLDDQTIVQLGGDVRTALEKAPLLIKRHPESV